MINGSDMSKDRLVLGVKDEIIPTDFTNLGWDAINIVKVIHKAAVEELSHRPIASVWDWSARTKNIFRKNSLLTVRSIIRIGEHEIKRLEGCGLVTRKEVYDVFLDMGIELPQWKPKGMFSR